MRGRNGTWHRYYYCRNHDPIRAGGESRRCPERNIRADALDGFVFDQVRTAITQPDLLLAGEQAITLTTPIPDDELLAGEWVPRLIGRRHPGRRIGREDFLPGHAPAQRSEHVRTYHFGR